MSHRSGIQPARAEASAPKNAAVQVLRCQPFHSTASSSIGFTNFKSSPRPKWKTQQELDAKNAEILAKQQPHVTYAEAIKSHKPRAWIGARKKVAWGRLFGPSSSSSSSGGGAQQHQQT
eukprot:g10265.t1